MENVTLTSVNVTDNGRIRWQYTASWDPPTEHHCAGLHVETPYSVIVSTGIHTDQSETSHQFVTDSEESFYVAVLARNDWNMESGLEVVTDVSHQLRTSIIISIKIYSFKMYQMYLKAKFKPKAAILLLTYLAPVFP